MQVVVITSLRSRRLQFVLDFVFVELAKTNYVLKDEIPQDKNEGDVFIGYQTQIDGRLDCRIHYSGLLKENSDIASTEWSDLSSWDDWDLSSTDIFAFIFFLLSRAEEYQLESKDPHDRFCYSDSWFYKNNLSSIPIVDLLIERVFKTVNNNKERSVLDFQGNYEGYVTVDLDHIFAYRAKPKSRILGGLFREFSEGKWTSIKQRLSFLKNGKDPFDKHDMMIDAIKKQKLKGKAFVLSASHGGVDNNIDPEHPLFKETVNKWSEFDVGLHPSYRASQSEEQLGKEYKLLTEIRGTKITASRMHFLKMKIPDTYYQLINLGIIEDWTLGFSDEVGFRSGTCHPHLWYDLKNEKITDLRLYPLMVMDGTLKDQLALSPKEALSKVGPVVAYCKHFKGTFTLLWHNSSFASDGGWKGWDSVFEEILELMGKGR